MFKKINIEYKLNKELKDLNINLKHFLKRDLYILNDDNSLILNINSYKELSLIYNENYIGSTKIINIYEEFKNLIETWKELENTIKDNDTSLYEILSYYENDIEDLKKNKLYPKILKLFIQNIYSFKILCNLLYNYYNTIIVKEQILLNNIINNIQTVLNIINTYNYKYDNLYEIIYNIINVLTNYSNYVNNNYIIFKGLFIKISYFILEIFKSNFIIKIINKIININKNVSLYNTENIYNNYIEIFIEILYNIYFINKYIVDFYRKINTKFANIITNKTKYIFNEFNNKYGFKINNTNNFGYYDNDINILKSKVKTKFDKLKINFKYTYGVIKNFEKLYKKNKTIKIPFFIKNTKITDKLTNNFIYSFALNKVSSLKKKKLLVKTLNINDVKTLKKFSIIKTPSYKSLYSNL